MTLSARAVRRLIIVILTVVASLLWRYATPALPTEAFVTRVVDGDTIQLLDGRLVRYIGIDAPEVRRRVGYQWVRDPEPWAEAATRANRHLVEGRQVRLEYDVQPHDRFGRLLAYVYVGDVMVNAELVREGYARLLTIAPDLRYAERFRALAEEARGAHRGIWSGRESTRRGNQRFPLPTSRLSAGLPPLPLCPWVRYEPAPCGWVGHRPAERGGILLDSDVRG